MDQFLLRYFLLEIKRQCEFATSHYNDLNHAVTERNIDEIFRSLQSFLSAAAIISRFLFPSRGKYDTRGQYLRNLLSVDQNSELAKRNARDFFEHFDERLDDWYDQSPHHNLLDTSIGGTDTPITGEIDYVRYFNSNTYSFIFLKGRCEIAPLYEEIRELLTSVNSELSKL